MKTESFPVPIPLPPFLCPKLRCPTPGRAAGVFTQSVKAALLLHRHGSAVTMQSERGRLARSRRPNLGRASFGRGAKWSQNGALKAVVTPTVSGLSTS